MKIISELKVREFVFTFACGLFVCFGIVNLIGTGQDALWAFTLAYTQGLVARNARQCREVIIIQDNIVNIIIKEAEELRNIVKYSAKYPPQKCKTMEKVMNISLGLN